MRKMKLTRANKSILLKALAHYYYQEKVLGHSTQKLERLMLLRFRCSCAMSSALSRQLSYF